MADTVAKIVLTAEDKTASAMASLRNGLSGIETQAISLRGAFGNLMPVLTFASLVTGFKSINDGVDALNDLKDATGSSIENISALEDVAARTGTAFETVGTSLVKFNQILNEAKPNTDAAAALKAIGLEAEALKQIDPAEALRVTAVALGQFADDGNKARVVQELFGKSLREVAPFLNDLKEQGALNAKVTTQQAEEAEKLNKQLFELQKNAKDAGRSLVSELVPAVNRMVQEFKLGLDASEGFFDALYTYGFKYGPDKSPAQQIAAINTELAKLNDARNNYVNSGYSTQGLDGDIKKLERQLGYFKELQRLQVDMSASNQSAAEARRLGLGGSSTPSVNFSGGSTSKGKSAAEQIDEQRTSLAAFVRQQQAQLDNTEKLTETQQALNFLASQGVQGQIPQVRELVLGLAERVDQEKKIAAVLAEQNRLQKEMDDAYQSRLKGMLESGPDAKLEKLRQDLMMLTAEFEEGRITEAQYLDALKGTIPQLSDGVKEATSDAREFGFVFNSALEDAVINGKDLGEVIQALTQDIARMAIRKAVTEPLGEAIGGSVSSIFKGFNFGDLFSFDGGGFTGAGSRSGGLDGKGGFLAVMHPQETVIDHTRVGYGSSQPIMQTFNFNGPADRAQVITAAQLGAAMAREQRIDDRNRGRY